VDTGFPKKIMLHRKAGAQRRSSPGKRVALSLLMSENGEKSLSPSGMMTP